MKIHRRLSEAIPPQLTEEQERTLNGAKLRGDGSARNHLILANVPLVHHLTSRYSWSGIDEQDLFASGLLGLVRAVDSFDPDKGRMATHLRIYVRKEVFETLAKNRSIVTLPRSVHQQALELRRAEERLQVRLGYEPAIEEIAKEAGISPKRALAVREATIPNKSIDEEVNNLEGNGSNLHEILNNDEKTPSEEISDRHAHDLVRGAVGKLSKRHRRVLAMKFNLDGRGGHTYETLGEELGVSASRVGGLGLEALRKLKREALSERPQIQNDGLQQNIDWTKLLQRAGWKV